MQNYNHRPNDCMRHAPYTRQVPSSSRTEYALLNGMPVAMAYVPWQEWHHIYPVGKALCQGTIFEELDKPFLGKGGYLK